MSAEFESTVMRKFGQCFPGTRKKLQSLDNVDDIVAQWESDMKHWPHALLIRAIEAIHRGEAVGPRYFEDDLWPMFIVDAARRINRRDERDSGGAVGRIADYLELKQRRRKEFLELQRAGQTCREQFRRSLLDKT